MTSDWPSSRRRAMILYVALLCWAAGVLWLSSRTSDELPELPDQAFLLWDKPFLLWDKLSHVLAYTVGGWLAAGALRVSFPGVPVMRISLAAIVLIAAFGVLDEAVQTLTPGRTGGDVGDWLADVIGAVIGALLSLLRTRRICRSGRGLV